MRLSLLLKWLIVVLKKAKFISTHAIKLEMRASKVLNRTLFSAIQLNLKVFIKTGSEFMT